MSGREPMTVMTVGNQAIPIRPKPPRTSIPEQNIYSTTIFNFIKNLPRSQKAEGTFYQSRYQPRAARLQIPNCNERILVATDHCTPKKIIIEMNGFITMENEVKDRPLCIQRGHFPYDGLKNVKTSEGYSAGFHDQLVWIDATRIGNDSQFVRRSCRPNAVLKHVVGAYEPLGFAIVATHHINYGDEITLPMDPDWEQYDGPLNCVYHLRDLMSCPFETRRNDEHWRRMWKEEMDYKIRNSTRFYMAQEFKRVKEIYKRRKEEEMRLGICYSAPSSSSMRTTVFQGNLKPIPPHRLLANKQMKIVKPVPLPQHQKFKSPNTPAPLKNAYQMYQQLHYKQTSKPLPEMPKKVAGVATKLRLGGGKDPGGIDENPILESPGASTSSSEAPKQALNFSISRILEESPAIGGPWMTPYQRLQGKQMILSYEAGSGDYGAQKNMSDDSETSSSSSSSGSEDTDDFWEMRCHCGLEHEDGDTVECSSCKTWQHMACMGLTPKSDHNNYCCELCKPRKLPLSKQEAVRKQRELLKKIQKSGGTGIQVQKAKKKALRKRGRRAAKKGKHASKKKSSPKVPQDPSHGYSDAAMGLLRRLAPTESAEHLLDQGRRQKTVKNFQNMSGLIATETVAENQMVMMIHGWVTLPEEVKRKPGGVPGIFLYDKLQQNPDDVTSTLSICISTRKTSPASHIRRSCKPNCRLVHALDQHQNLGFIVTAVKRIERGDEITLPFDPDWRESEKPLQCADHLGATQKCPLKKERKLFKAEMKSRRERRGGMGGEPTRKRFRAEYDGYNPTTPFTPEPSPSPSSSSFGPSPLNPHMGFIGKTSNLSYTIGRASKNYDGDGCSKENKTPPIAGQGVHTTTARLIRPDMMTPQIPRANQQLPSMRRSISTPSPPASSSMKQFQKPLRTLTSISESPAASNEIHLDSRRDSMNSTSSAITPSGIVTSSGASSGIFPSREPSESDVTFSEMLTVAVTLSQLGVTPSAPRVKSPKSSGVVVPTSETPMPPSSAFEASESGESASVNKEPGISTESSTTSP